MPGVRSGASLLAACALAAACGYAIAASATFGVEVTLHNPVAVPTAGAPAGSRGQPRTFALCTSGTAGDGRLALVEVVCTVGPFVTITPLHGGSALAAEPARSEVRPGTRMAALLAAAGGFDPRETVGTLTALHVSNATGNGSALEMLVSF